jgi:uncharacterized protein YndB with AHSA1/START domain
MDAGLRLEREFDLPREVVWEALVDPVLAEGWLHPEALLTDEVEELEYVEPASPQVTAVLEVRSEELGAVRIELDEVEGGTRGRSTLLRLRVSELGDPRFHPPAVAVWRVRLDQLDELLRGHPVDWDNWERDRGADYEIYLSEARSAI